MSSDKHCCVPGCTENQDCQNLTPSCMKMSMLSSIPYKRKILNHQSRQTFHIQVFLRLAMYCLHVPLKKTIFRKVVK
ncbi:unnamed protein product [Parnassius apollo]|uniref:(apollo) hypothetical protein n=1 Tax=Parnassius apollo TaxID=110799 RepID=A0A8S3WK07_PARAO|nr:unnamed protein product [Parnassius apollo]